MKRKVLSQARATAYTSQRLCIKSVQNTFRQGQTVFSSGSKFLQHMWLWVSFRNVAGVVLGLVRVLFWNRGAFFIMLQYLNSDSLYLFHNANHSAICLPCVSLISCFGMKGSPKELNVKCFPSSLFLHRFLIIFESVAVFHWWGMAWHWCWRWRVRTGVCVCECVEGGR